MYKSSDTQVLHMYNLNLTYVMLMHKWSFI